MAIRGPLGVKRPFAKHNIIIDPEEMKMYVVNTGPLGGPRPLTKINPEVEEERVQECMVSDAGIEFAKGRVDTPNVTDVRELPPEQRMALAGRAESWCRGMLESTSVEDFDYDDMEELIETQLKFDEGVGVE